MLSQNFSIKIQMKQMGEKQIDKVCEKSENLKDQKKVN